MNAQEFAERYGDSLNKARAIDLHVAAKKAWSPLQRFLHKILISWHCPVCKLEKAWRGK